ncbi:hypothetical protein GCM10029978_066460 [Actinoallomurus acanthiterrae]
MKEHVVEATREDELNSTIRSLHAGSLAEPTLVEVEGRPAAVLLPLELYLAVADRLDDTLTARDIADRVATGGVIYGTIADLASAAGIEKFKSNTSED